MAFENFTPKTREVEKVESSYIDFAQDSLNELTAARFNLMTTKSDDEARKVSQSLNLRHVEDYWLENNQQVDLDKFDNFFPTFRKDFNELIDKINSGITRSELDPAYQKVDAQTRGKSNY